ncbi:hypothetical protein PPYR_08516 [Photinus pyralis]|uniref:Protein kinase C-binding protein 1 n=1 Tax=Photinus pyralis TaxID=7054 RepID=A0A5N4AJR1_PHOPY|nr:protein kinase C-binding protein 1 isoform X2 [Photinus pyralis]KAB0797523.1 hypothetical protein PPYR_08516 [Photinus pyralis]
MSTEQEPVQAPVMFDITEETSDSGTTECEAKEAVIESDLAIGQMNVDNVSAIDSSQIMTIESDSPEDVSAITQQVDSETIANDIPNEEQDAGTSKPSRELKLLLALSKEANLDTNIAHKRKSVEPLGRSEITNKRRHSTGSSNDSTAMPDEPHPEKKTDVDEIGTDEANSSALVSKDGKSREGKRVVEGAVDENGVRNKKLSNTFVTFNNEKKDSFCWQCHHSGSNFFCKSCPRSFHQKCLKQNVAQPNHWLCPECVTIMQAENLKQRSSAMRNMTLVHLCGLLKFALRRMLEVAGCEPFIHAVNDEDFPDYKMYIICPMDVTRLEKSIKKNLYGSPQAFEADAKWILHNSIIFNSYQSKLTSIAKSMLKICKQEMLEIENCATCYLNANTKKKTWFVEVCPKPHIPVWAKLKGFPYWPAKAMKCNPSGMVDVRFFGAHDRAWVHYKECFLFSLKDPNSNKQKKNDILESVKELQLYVDNLKKVYGEFRYADYRVQLEPESFEIQLKLMLPTYPNITRARKSIYKIPKTNGTTPVITEEPEKENEVGELNIKKLFKSDGSSEEDNVSLDMFMKKSGDSLNSHKATDSPLRGGSVRMRGGITNTSGKIKILPKLTPESNIKKRLSTEELGTPPKLPRINSDTPSDSIEMLSELDATNTTMESDVDTSSPQRHATGVAGENLEDTSPSQTVAKISDRLMKKLTGSEKVPTDSPPTPTKRTTETDIFLETFKTKGLTMLEKITELSADTEIFETGQDDPKESNDGGEFTKQEQCDDLLCTEVDLEEKHNLLLHDDSFASSSVNAEDVPVRDINSHSTEAHMNLDKRDKHVEDCTESASSEKETDCNNDNVIHTRSPSPPDNNLNNRNEVVTSPQNTEQLTETFSDGPPQLSENTEDDSGVSILNNGTSESEISTLQRNMLTVVSVEEIKKKNLDARRLSGSQPTPKSILENRLSNNCQDSTKSNKDNGSGETETVVIKSEPSSEDEPSDSEYLEKKRKYLSALNISEKLPEKPKVHKIRTRSKTEERATFKIVDNLSKVIDDVATHYSIKHANEAITVPETPKRKEIFIKPLSSLQELKQRARKSFPTPKNTQSPKNETLKLCKSIITPVFSVKPPPQKLTVISKPSDTSNCTKVILTTSSANSILPPNQPITYTPSQLTPLLSMIQSTSSSGVLLPPLSFTYAKTAESQPTNPTSLSASVMTTAKTVTSSNIVTRTIATTPIVASSTGSNDQTNAIMEEVRIVSSAVPENVSKAINEIMLGVPPKLKPRPPGPLSTHFDDGVPSSAGVVTSKVNSISHRLNDYFRGMLVELLHEAGTVANPEAEITRLKLENEELKHKHSEEILEIKKNISSILKDMQKSLTDEKERTIEETRATCEIETLKRVEDAKSKQWCACCSKEAQFYCCWNTSYCDYPCQQKHWSAHMSKCTQQIQSGQLQSSGTSSGTTKATNPLVLRPTSAPKGFKATIIGKPGKVLVNRPTSVNKVPFTFARTTGNHITLVESTPGNYELLGSGGPISVGGKIIANFGKKLTGSVLAVTSTANSNLDLATVKKITVNPAQTLPVANKPTVID